MRAVRYRFGDFEVDTDAREVRQDGELQTLQPQAFAVLEYLLRHRDRAVPKEELLRELWPDAVVGEGSLQRAVSLVRSALGGESAAIRTVPRHGYRFAAPVTAEGEGAVGGERIFRPRYTKSGDVHIAYHTVGEPTDCDIVMVPGWAFPMRAYFDHPDTESVIGRLARLGRVVLFDKRGTGLSDRVKELPSMEQRIDDLRAVLAAVGSKEAILAGFSEGGPLCVLYALSHPERTRGLLLVGAFARWSAAPDYPAGWSESVVEELRAYIGREWGRGGTMKPIAGRRADEPAVQAWAAKAEQEGASPGAALELMAMNLQVDVRPLLSAVKTPTRVLHHTDDPVIDVANGRYLAAHLPNAVFEEVEGSDHCFLFEDPARVLAAVSELLAGDGERIDASFLSTLVAVDGELDAAEAVLHAHRGERVGEGVHAFDGPQRAIRFARALVDGDLAARVAVHTGEVRRAGDGLEGPGVDVARRLLDGTPNGAVWVSRVVRDLLHGSPLRFEPVDQTDLPFDVLRSR